MRALNALREHAIERVANALEEAAAAHDRSDFDEIRRLLESVDQPDTRINTPEFDEIGVALNFLEGWCAASRGDWLYYDGIEEKDWPRLGRLAAQALREGREIPTPSIRRHFGVEGSHRDRSIRGRLEDHV